MFSKLVKALFKETTNTKDISSVTFNSTGTYNPRYGKQKVSVSGRGGTGSYAAGEAYYNYVEGYMNYNYVAGAASTKNVGTGGNAIYQYTPAYPATNPPTPVAGNYEGTNSGYYQYGNVSGSNPGSEVYSYTTYDNYDTYGNFEQDFYTYQPGSPNYNPGTYVLGFDYYNPPYTTPGNSYMNASAYDVVDYNDYVEGNWNTATNPSYPYAAYVNPAYPYAGTNSSVTNAGTSTNVFGVSLPGGYGGDASVISPTLTTAVPKYGTSSTVTVPSGGYVTITFTL